MTTQTKPGEAAAAAAGDAFLSVRDLKVHFSSEDGIVKAVDGLSFDLERGQTLGIVGESGSGKSVTNLAVLGLHNRRTTAIDGSITLDGQELTDASEKQLESAARQEDGDDLPGRADRALAVLHGRPADR